MVLFFMLYNATGQNAGPMDPMELASAQPPNHLQKSWEPAT